MLNEFRFVRLAFFVVLWLFPGPGRILRAQQAQAAPTFEDLLQKLSSAPADSCRARPGQDLSDLELRLFMQADSAIARALNDDEGSRPGATPRARAIGALKRLELASAEINRAWPDDKRFHFELLDLPPILVVKMTYRNRARFSAFGSFTDTIDAARGKRWQPLGALDQTIQSGGGYDSLELFPLLRGPSNSPRFLAEFQSMGCGSGLGVDYYAYEWSGGPTGELDQIINIEGAESRYRSDDQASQADPMNDFRPIGELRTNGQTITLPYCWFSAVDTWDNPSLCGVASYDLSGDQAEFAGVAYNRPDLVPIARAIEHAEAHDYPAVLAYCGSPDVAHTLVRDLPPFVSSVGGFEIEQTGAFREHVELGYDPVFSFDVQERRDRWVVVAFSVE
jgi:hypothetical protein